MSNRRHQDALLKGYDGPLFTIASDALGTQLDAGPLGNTRWLGRSLGQFVNMVLPGNRTVTSDGYHWYCALVVLDGRAMILIPHQGDVSRTDGTIRDRAVAVYVKRGVDPMTVDAVIMRIRSAIAEQQAADAAAFEQENRGPTGPMPD